MRKRLRRNGLCRRGRGVGPVEHGGVPEIGVKSESMCGRCAPRTRGGVTELLTRLAGGILDAAGFPAFSVGGTIDMSIRMSVQRCGGNGRGHGVELAVGTFER